MVFLVVLVYFCRYVRYRLSFVSIDLHLGFRYYLLLFLKENGTFGEENGISAGALSCCAQCSSVVVHMMNLLFRMMNFVLQYTLSRKRRGSLRGPAPIKMSGLLLRIRRLGEKVRFLHGFVIDFRLILCGSILTQWRDGRGKR